MAASECKMEKQCCVFECFSTSKERHPFPNPIMYREYYQRWLNACENPALKQQSEEFISSRLWICDKHFSKTDYFSKHKLLSYAIPRINLPYQKTLRLTRQALLNSQDSKQPYLGNFCLKN